MSETTGRFKGNKLLSESGHTLYKVAKDGGINYKTVHRWLNNDGSRALSTDVLIGFLRGLGYSDEQIKALPLGEVFEIN